MCEHVYAHVCAHMCTCKGQLVSMSITFHLILLDRTPHRTLSSSIQRDQLPRPAHGPSCLHPLLLCWDYIHTPPHPAFYVGAHASTPALSSQGIPLLLPTSTMELLFPQHNIHAKMCCSLQALHEVT